MAMLVVLGTGLALFMLVIANVLLGQVGIVRADLERRVEAKRLHVEQLTVEVARLESPSRIATRARELGMTPAADALPLAPSTVRGPSPVRGRP